MIYERTSVKVIDLSGIVVSSPICQNGCNGRMPPHTIQCQNR